MESSVPDVSNVEELRVFPEQVQEKLFNLSTSRQSIQSCLNTTNLRLDALEHQISSLEYQTAGSHGGGIRRELSLITRVVSESVEQSNRVAHELDRVLMWRNRFTSALQSELILISHQIAAACPQLDQRSKSLTPWTN